MLNISIWIKQRFGAGFDLLDTDPPENAISFKYKWENFINNASYNRSPVLDIIGKEKFFVVIFRIWVILKVPYLETWVVDFFA